MKFETRQRIDGSPDEVEKAMLDERYLDFLLKHHGVLLELALLERRDDGQKVHRKVRYRPRPVIKTVGTKEVPEEWFAFIETSTYDRSRREMTFTNTPTTPKIANLLQNQGTLRIVPKNGATERVIEGDIGLKLPFLLKPLALLGEKMIQSEGLKILDADVPILNRFISEVVRPRKAE